MATWRHWSWLALSLTLSACLLPKLNKAERSGDPGLANTAGAGGSGGQGGEGGAPETGPIPIREFATNQVDLLLMVDNSISMADKQRLLADAVSGLVERITRPPCVENGTPTGTMSDPSGSCAKGAPQFQPPTDIHIAVITSSLGSHGASGPNDVCVDPSSDDHAHLLGKIRGLKNTWNDSGFLAWDSRRVVRPPGINDPAQLQQSVSDMLAATGEHGCGYESSLESWYRFLVDPEPPESVRVNDGVAEPVGIDKELLAERKAFLRPGSALAIVLFTDENDCSIIDSGWGWLVARAMPMVGSSSECSRDPNDPCCRSCQDTAPHEGCGALADDSECSKGKTLDTSTDDELALRCWQQKRRFGMDLLYPTKRYVDALTSPTIARRSDGKLIQNPLLAARSPSAISLLGIVGVPWQDLATQDSLHTTTMTYLTPRELADKGRWQVILGEPEARTPVPPSDPFMIETPEDRTGLADVPQVNPVSRDKLVSASSQDPFANRINGHEQVNVANQDLQYACTFRLPEPRECDQTADAADVGCECYAEDASYNRSLCQPSEGGPATTTQYGAKAYPGLRQLQVLRDLGDIGLTASICPKSVERGGADYGYTPAMELLAQRITQGLVTCFERALSVDARGQVPCRVVTARPDSPVCECPAGTSPVTSSDLGDRTVQGLRDIGVCGDDLAQSCGDLCLCEIPQLSGSALASCQNDAQAPNAPGFCYINAVQGEANAGSDELLQECPTESRRLIRFVGDAYLRDSEAFLLCE